MVDGKEIIDVTIIDTAHLAMNVFMKEVRVTADVRYGFHVHETVETKWKMYG